MADTNSIENSWSPLRRGHLGIRHAMSRKPRHVHEFAGRRNMRRDLGALAASFDGRAPS